MRREQARWRLSAVLLSLLLAFGAAMSHIAGANQSGPDDAHRSPSAIVVTNTASTFLAVGMRDGHIRLAANRGHGGIVLFVVALAALLAGLRRSHVWSLMTRRSWMLPTAVGTAASRGRAPPTPRLA